MVNPDRFPNSIGLDGADAGDKTRLSLTLKNALELMGFKAVYIPLPLSSSTASGNFLKFWKQKEIPFEILAAVFATNRYEIMPGALRWLENVKHWAVFDRTAKSGPVFAEGFEHHLGVGEGRLIGQTLVGGTPQTVNDMKRMDSVWYRALDEKFPDVALGFLLTRPLSESMEILKRRSIASGGNWKKDFDSNVRLQRRVRTGFIREIRGLENWMSLRIRGLAFDENEFRDWEITTALRIWGYVRKKFLLDISPAESRVIIANARDAIGLDTNRVVTNETRRTVRLLSHPTSVRGLHIWK